jgi:hypothetical protein
MNKNKNIEAATKLLVYMAKKNGQFDCFNYRITIGLNRYKWRKLTKRELEKELVNAQWKMTDAIKILRA